MLPITSFLSSTCTKVRLNKAANSIKNANIRSKWRVRDVNLLTGISTFTGAPTGAMAKEYLKHTYCSIK